MKKTIQIIILLTFSISATAGWFNNDKQKPVQQQDKKTYTLKLAETWPSNFPIFGDTTKKFKKLAEAMSNGRLKIRIDSKNKHKAPLGLAPTSAMISPAKPGMRIFRPCKSATELISF
jgi:TRAP-type mannitol/chloroaromatic compound transport system substrate-binding protein